MYVYIKSLKEAYIHNCCQNNQSDMNGILHEFHFINKSNLINSFTAEVAIMRLLGSAPLPHLCGQKRRSKVTGLHDLMTLFIDLGCSYCKQMQRAFNVLKKHAKLIENRFSRSKVQLTRVWVRWCEARALLFVSLFHTLTFARINHKFHADLTCQTHGIIQP
jgi:hypothetical protein